ncbi:hypothetical protein [Prochlorococcus sp. MIT 1341]|uniref:hypothetical protein n=1 Tax=Prochlorococcus sp. MIT 1341 TaxID=3096221 RepID=UPI002A763B88|nr:hypothetical protein [Prochlorococcus sp. MIT 1341]
MIKFLSGTLFMQIVPISASHAEIVWDGLQIGQETSGTLKSFQESSPKEIQISPQVGPIQTFKKKSNLTWETFPASKNNSSSQPVIWENIPEDKYPGNAPVVWDVIEDQELPDKEKEIKEYFGELKIPNNYGEAQAVFNQLEPRPEDYQLPLRIGNAVPTANQVFESDIRLNAYQISPFMPGESGGTGNQNYSIQFDFGITDRLQLSGFASQADDPLFAKIESLSSQPGNFWESFGAEFKFRLASDPYGLYQDAPGKYWNLALAASIEGWNVGSGGCDSALCKGNNDASPNIFNDSGQRVFTRNVIGSIALPISWNTSSTSQLTFSPGVSFLPEKQGSGQGGAGDFYGNNYWVSGGLFWKPIPEIELFTSTLLSLGPGNNSFDKNLNFERVPIFTGGLTWNLNPRIALEGALTNGWGATPATSLLALPSSNQLGYSAKFVYNSGAPDTPQLPLTKRQHSLASGGLTVNTALVPPDGTTQLWGNLDNRGNIFGSLSYSISNIFQLDLYKAGLFSQVDSVGGEPSSSLERNYTTDDGLHWRVGGKAVALSPLRGAPIWTSGRISLGRNNDAKSYQGYIFAESINTYEVNSWLAVNVNPKAVISGVSDPWGVGLSANMQLGNSFQLIPEINLVGSHREATNMTLALRWLARPDTTYVDFYISNAAGMLDIGQMIRSDDLRLGTKVSIVF